MFDFDADNLFTTDVTTDVFDALADAFGGQPTAEPQQTEEPVTYHDHEDFAAPRFGSWEKWPSGTWYEYTPDHTSTGNWSH